MLHIESPTMMLESPSLSPTRRASMPSLSRSSLSTPDLRRVQIQEEGISLEARASDSFNLIESPTTSPSPLIAFPALAKKA